MEILLSCHLQIILELQFSTGVATSFSRALDVNHYELTINLFGWLVADADLL